MQGAVPRPLRCVYRGAGCLARAPFFSIAQARTGAHPEGSNVPNQVFFVRNLGFVAPTEVRRISFEETLRFEKVHEDVYQDFGFELVFVEPGSLQERVSIIKAAIRELNRGTLRRAT